MKTWVIFLCTVLLLPAFGEGVKPRFSYVPDSQTAVKIAEAVLIPVYGEKQVKSERPFTARLNHDVWTITGTLHCPGEHGGRNSLCVGGVAEVRIAKSNGHVLYML